MHSWRDLEDTQARQDRADPGVRAGCSLASAITARTCGSCATKSRRPIVDYAHVRHVKAEVESVHSRTQCRCGEPQRDTGSSCPVSGALRASRPR